MDVSIRLDWSGGHTASVQPVNVLHVQGLGEEVYLSFGHAPAPLALLGMNDEQMTEYLKAHMVPVQQISRFTLPIGTARALLKGLQDVLGNVPTKTSPTAGADAEVNS